MVMLQRWSLMEGEWSCYRSGHQWRENGHVTEVASLKKENGHVTEVVTNGGRMDVTEVVTNGGGMVMLQQWSLMEGEWLSYGWMNGVLGHFYALSRLNWAGDNLG